MPDSSLTYDREFIGIKKVKWDALFHGLFVDKQGKEEYVRLNAYQAKQLVDQLIKTEV